MSSSSRLFLIQGRNEGSRVDYILVCDLAFIDMTCCNIIVGYFVLQLTIVTALEQIVYACFFVKFFCMFRLKQWNAKILFNLCGTYNQWSPRVGKSNTWFASVLRATFPQLGMIKCTSSRSTHRIIGIESFVKDKEESMQKHYVRGSPVVLYLHYVIGHTKTSSKHEIRYLLNSALWCDSHLKVSHRLTFSGSRGQN